MMTPIAIKLPAAMSATAGRGGPNFAMLSPTPMLTATIPCMINMVDTSGLFISPADRPDGFVRGAGWESGITARGKDVSSNCKRWEKLRIVKTAARLCEATFSRLRWSDACFPHTPASLRFHP